MTTEAISIMVHRKAGLLMVTPWALSNVGFQCLDDLFVAQPGQEGLIHALDLALERAHAASNVPHDQRFLKHGECYWKRAGFDSEKDFVKDERAVSVLLSVKRTEFQFLVPMKDNAGMEAKSPPKTREAGLPAAEIAREVFALFDEHP